MKKSSFVYWMYSLVNSQFGKQVKIKRDSLRLMYPQHKYHMDLQLTGGVTSQRFHSLMSKAILERGFKLEEPNRFSNSNDSRKVQVSLTDYGSGRISINVFFYNRV